MITVNDLETVSTPVRRRGKMVQPTKNDIRKENERLKSFAMGVCNLLKYEYPDISQMCGIFDITKN